MLFNRKVKQHFIYGLPRRYAPYNDKLYEAPCKLFCLGDNQLVANL